MKVFSRVIKFCVDKYRGIKRRGVADDIYSLAILKIRKRLRVAGVGCPFNGTGEYWYVDDSGRIIFYPLIHDYFTGYGCELGEVIDFYCMLQQYVSLYENLSSGVDSVVIDLISYKRPESNEVIREQYVIIIQLK